MQALRLILRNLDDFRRSFIVIFLVGMASAATSFFIPVLLTEFTRSNLSQTEFVRVTAGIIILYYATMPLQWVLRKYGEALGSKYGIYLRIKYFKKLEAQPINQLIKYHSGYALSLISSVADGLGRLATEILWGLTYILTNLTLFFYFTARESELVAVVNLLLMCVFVLFSTYLAGRIVPIMQVVNVSRASLLERYVDFAGNVLTVKRLGIMPFVERELHARTDDAFDGIQQFQNFHAKRWLILHSLFGLTYLSTIIYMLWQISQNNASASILILFVASYATVKGNVERLSENLKSLIEMDATIKNLEEVLPDGPQPKPEERRTNWKRITLSGIEFRYPHSSVAIEIPEFHLTRGEKICVMGPSGEGKTTLLNLLAGLYPPGSGQRLLDGTPYTTALQEQTTLISQEAELFNISLYENISLGRSVTRETIEEYFSDLDLLSWLQKLEHGLDTKIGERGVRMSAGQRQRINLIRGLLLDRDFYLLDEPTSHLDRRTEQRVVEFLQQRLQGKTAVIVSHRDAVRTLCSRFYIMDNHRLRPE